MPFITVRTPMQWWGSIALLAQLAAGSAFVFLAAQERSPAVEQAMRQQRVDDRIGTAESRLEALERLNIPARLAVLDDMKDRQQRIEYLTYGVIATLGGNLLLGLMELRNKKR